MSQITTHILDTSTGTPAAAVAVALYRLTPEGARELVADGATDADGRAPDLLPAPITESGDFLLRFDSAGYFQASGRESFYPYVEVAFRFDPAGGHYHVPLLLSPFGYSTYRGS